MPLEILLMRAAAFNEFPRHGAVVGSVIPADSRGADPSFRDGGALRTLLRIVVLCESEYPLEAVPAGWTLENVSWHG